MWMCCRIIGLIFGLRRKELRSAHLLTTVDWRFVRISFHPKGDPKLPRITAYRYAFGVLGQFLWWPRFYAKLSGRCRTLEPCFDTGKILTAVSCDPLTVAPQGCTGGSVLNALPRFGLEASLLKSAFITLHSDHGTINDVIRSYTSRLGFDVETDCLIAGHWMGGTPSSGAGGSDAARPSSSTRRAQAQSSRDAASRLAMVGRYGDQCIYSEGPETIWRALSLAYEAIRLSPGGWESVPPGSGWQLAKEEGLRRRAAGLEAWLDPLPPFLSSSPPSGWPSDS